MKPIILGALLATTPLLSLQPVWAAEQGVDVAPASEEVAAAADPASPAGGPTRLVPRRLVPPSAPVDPSMPDAAAALDTLPSEGGAAFQSDLPSYVPRGVVSDAPDATVRTLVPRPGLKEAGIEIGVLGRVDEASVGLLSENEGGLGSEMWRGTERKVVEEGLAQLAMPQDGPTLRDLSRRLLLSTASAPSGVTQGRSLLALRLARLNEGGYAADVRRLVRQAGLKQITPDAAIEIIEAFFANGDVLDACRFLSTLPAGGSVTDDPAAAFALKLTAFCQLQADDPLAANLTLDVAREQGLQDDLFFALMAKAVDGFLLPFKTRATLTPFDLALYEAAGQALPDAVLKAVPASALPGLARNRQQPLALRLGASELAAGYGLIPSAELADVYLDAAGSPKADQAGVVFDRGTAYAALLAEAVPQKRARLIGDFVSIPAAPVVRHALSQVVQPALATAPPSRGVLESAPAIIRTLIEQRDGVRAGMWLNMVRETEAAAPGLATLELMHLVMTLPDNGLISPEVASKMLLDAVAAGGPDRDFAALTAVLIEPLGIGLDGAVWPAIFDSGELATGHMPLADTMLKLDQAGEQGKRGEVVLSALLAMGEVPLAEVHPQAVAATVTALRQAGLRDEATSLVLDVMLAKANPVGS